MADASRTGGGGKSINMINAQRRRMMAITSQQIKDARKQGDKEKVNQLKARQNQIRNIAGRYSYAIQRRQQANNGGENPTSLKRNQQYSRSIYTNGQMSKTRAGNVGQFRTGASTYATRARRRNQYQSGIYIGNAAVKRGTGEARRRAVSFGSRNPVMKAGVKKGVSSGYRAQTNNRQALESRKQRTGKGYRVKSNTTNAQNGRIASIIRFQRRERKRAQENGQQIFR